MRSLQGGSAGTSPFIDNRADNDFFGSAVNVNTAQVIVGELPRFVGGWGGGGGGDLSFNTNCSLNDPAFANDSKGGGGGGGGPAL